MIGKTLLLSSAILAMYGLHTIHHSLYTQSAGSFQSMSWGEIEHTRQRNRRNKAQKRKRS